MQILYCKYQEKMSKIALRVIGITEAEQDEKFYLLLMKERGGKRHLPVLLGKRDANAIMMAMHHITALHPMLYESFASCCLQFDIQLQECYIYRMENEVYDAYLIFKQGDNMVTVDSRLADAMAVAISMDAPIVVEEAVLESVQSRLVIKDREPDLEQLSIDDLELLLQKAVAKEDYEFASKIRDLITEKSINGEFTETLDIQSKESK